jgi:hypothetical protein
MKKPKPLQGSEGKLSRLRAQFKNAAKKLCTYALVGSIISSATIAPVFAHASDSPYKIKDTSKDKNLAFEEVPPKLVETNATLFRDDQTKIANALMNRMATGEANETTALICSGGGTSGAVSAGSACALADMGYVAQYQGKHNCDLPTAFNALHDAQLNGTSRFDLQPVFDEVFASSVGTLIYAYILSENLYDGASIFSQDLDENFLSKARVVEGFLTDGKTPVGMNLSYLEQGILGGFSKEKALDVLKAVEKLNAPGAPDYYIVVTDPDTFTSKVIRANDLKPKEFLELTLAACNILGTAGPTNGMPFDAKYTGQTVPVTKSDAKIKVILDNQPVGHTGFDGLTAKALNQFVLMCSSTQLNDTQYKQLKEITAASEARNQQEVRDAHNDTKHNLFLGTPADDPSLSSSELDKGLLKSATERAYLNTVAQFVDARVQEGKITLPKGKTIYVEPPTELGKPSNYLKIKAYPNGRVVYKLVQSVPQKAKPTAQSSPYKNPNDIAIIATAPLVAGASKRARRKYEALENASASSSKPYSSRPQKGFKAKGNHFCR